VLTFSLKLTRKTLLCKKDGGSQLTRTGNTCSYLTSIVKLTKEFSLMEKRQELGMHIKVDSQECLHQLLLLLTPTKIKLTISAIVELNQSPLIMYHTEVNLPLIQ
jgi:hypothetical protein